MNVIHSLVLSALPFDSILKGRLSKWAWVHWLIYLLQTMRKTSSKGVLKIKNCWREKPICWRIQQKYHITTAHFCRWKKILIKGLVFCVIFTTILKFPPWFPALAPWLPTFFPFSSIFPAFPCWFLALTFPSHSLHSHPYSQHFTYSIPPCPILTFTDSLLSL